MELILLQKHEDYEFVCSSQQVTLCIYQSQE